MSLERIVQIFHRILITSVKALILTLLMAYGGMLYYSYAYGFHSGSYTVTRTFTYEALEWVCGPTRFSATDGVLVIAEREGVENYVAIEGAIRAEWPERIRNWSHVPPDTLGRLRISVNPADLKRIIGENQLQELLPYETRDMQIRSHVGKLFGKGQYKAGLLPLIETYRPAPVGGMSLAILDDKWRPDMGGWTLTTGTPFPRTEPSWLVRKTRSLPFQLLALAPLLIVIGVAVGFLACVAQALSWVLSLVQSPGGFREAPLRHTAAGLLALLTSASLISVYLLL